MPIPALLVHNALSKGSQLANQQFKVRSKIPCFVESTSPTGRDSFCVHIDKTNDSHILVSIELHDKGNGPEIEAQYQFYGDSFPGIVNWLRNAGLVN